MTLHCEVAQGSETLKAAIAASIRNVTALRGEVKFREPNTLPDDGKLIEDLRSYS
jgi:phenylacetate-CoA ligase